LGVSFLVAFVCFFSNAQAQKLKAFGGLTEAKVGPITKKVPYTDVNSYLGHAAPNTEDEVVDGKKEVLLYLSMGSSCCARNRGANDVASW